MKCISCGVDHDPYGPHDMSSTYYHKRFKAENGRKPTHADAAAHCSEGVRHAYLEYVCYSGKWTSPQEGEPIAEPY